MINNANLLEDLLKEISTCTFCANKLKHLPRPVLSAHENSKVIIIGQAPGSVVHQTGIPWDDKSGDRLRSWLGVTKEQFYNEKLFALIPMGFCYPGKGKTGDLPPRTECAPKWHPELFKQLKQPSLRLLIGSYAQNYYLKDLFKGTLTDTVKNFEAYLPSYFPLPHPSPRNNIWLKKNEWFEAELIPILQEKIKNVL